VAFILAFRVEADFFKIDRLTGVNHEILLLEDENLKFSKRIRIEYSNDKTISCRKWSILPIRFKNKKPLVSGFITQDNWKVVEGEFSIDSGSSDALWLFDQHEKVVKISSFFPNFLGIGINGDLFGDRGKISSFQLGSFILKKIKSCLPW